MTLPESFLERLRGQLGSRFDDYLACMEQPHSRGLRINALKFSAEDENALGFALAPVPFAPEGRRILDEAARPGLSPWHHAGAYYMQEPSAMSAVTALDPQPGERVLDMCAAPGGKTTQIAARLAGRGLVWANEYVRSRAQILVSNLERTGVRNAVVSSLHPDRIAEGLTEWFDRVLVDAPCSGEGMFRRDPQAVEEWSPEHVRTCAARQAGILDSAARCLRPGGVLVYSTCTFAPDEDELAVAAFLERHPDFSLEEIPADFGTPADRVGDFPTDLARRVWPMDGGEGHFVARLRRAGEGSALPSFTAAEKPLKPDVKKCVDDLLAACCAPDGVPQGRVAVVGEDIYILPEDYPDGCGLPVVRAGVLAGTVKKGGRALRAEPEHALFMALRPADCRACVDLAPDDPRLSAFLHGEEIEVSDDLGGYAAVACGGVICGFGKCSGGRLKNKYPKGLRLL